MIRRKKIKPIFNSELSEISENEVLVKTGSGMQKIPNDYVFIFAGGIPPFKMLQEIGIRFGSEAEAAG